MPDVDNLRETLQAAIERLVRGGWDELESTLISHDQVTPVRGTRATLRCHFLRSDPNGRARLDALAQQLADMLIHYCIPRRKIIAIRQLDDDKRDAATSRLARDASKLFTQTQMKTGEGAELLLYAMLEKLLGIPQVLSKMSLKTSTEMQIHGADGVHAKLEDNGDLALYWGEAKMYESVSAAMADCLDSLSPYLIGNAHEQDVFLLKHYADAGTEDITIKLLEYFDNASMLSAQVEMRGACLIGFSHADYPALPRDLEQLQEGLDTALKSWRRSMKTRLTNRSLENYTIELFFVPVPSAQDFRDAIKNELGIPLIVAPADVDGTSATGGATP